MPCEARPLGQGQTRVRGILVPWRIRYRYLGRRRNPRFTCEWFTEVGPDVVTVRSPAEILHRELGYYDTHQKATRPYDLLSVWRKVAQLEERAMQGLTGQEEGR